jgi:carboxyl-terminal processing protease
MLALATLLVAVGAALTPGPLAWASDLAQDAPMKADRAESAADSLAIVIEVLREAFDGIREVYVEEVPAALLLEAAMEGVRSRLDPHTRLLSPEEFESLRSPHGREVGIGVILDFDDAYPLVREVRRGSPAAAAGLSPGDRLLSVNETSLAALDADTVHRLFRGPAGSQVKLFVASPGETSRALMVSRGYVNRAPIDTTLICGGRIGHLRLERFARGTAIRLEAILLGWAQRDLTGLIIDLRGNPGGYLDEAIDAADLLLPPGHEIVRTEGRLPEENGTWISRRPALCPCLPRVVLIDSLSASSAEVFAGALKGAPQTVLLGEPTYGKRSVQRVRPLRMGGGLKVTCARFSTAADTLPSIYGPPAPSDDPAGPLGAMGSAGFSGRAAGAGACVRPDSLLARAVLPAGWEVAERRGLLARFAQEETLLGGDLEALPYWDRNAHQAVPALADWPAAAHVAPGFERWTQHLAACLARWDCPLPGAGGAGAAGQSTRAPGPSGAGEAYLRTLWFVDWASERWGADVGEAVGLELDPWVQRARDVILRIGAGRPHAVSDPPGPDPGAVRPAAG